jgi:hypothetical protein
MPQMLLVHEPHQPQVLGARGHGPIVPTRTVQAQPLALSSYAPRPGFRIDPTPQLSRRTRQLFFQPVDLHLQAADLLKELLFVGSLLVAPRAPVLEQPHRLLQ